MNQQDQIKLAKKEANKRKKELFNKQFEDACRSLKYVVTPEFKFCEYRKFRSDWLVEFNNKKVLVEYEGISGSPKARHTTLTGYTNDCEKYNIAALHGYFVLRFTALNWKQVFEYLEKYFSD